eukprot:5265968-Amphidinium_carterae.2
MDAMSEGPSDVAARLDTWKSTSICTTAWLWLACAHPIREREIARHARHTVFQWGKKEQKDQSQFMLSMFWAPRSMAYCVKCGAGLLGRCIWCTLCLARCPYE